jgi:hypothetical protein
MFLKSEIDSWWKESRRKTGNCCAETLEKFSIAAITHRKNMSKYQQMGIVQRLQSLYLCRQILM